MFSAKRSFFEVIFLAYLIEIGFRLALGTNCDQSNYRGFSGRSSLGRESDSLELPRLHAQKAVNRACIVRNLVVGELLLAIALVEGSQLFSMMFEFQNRDAEAARVRYSIQMY
jgi:hypothetical protein